jgi:hypothetical protein
MIQDPTTLSTGRKLGTYREPQTLSLTLRLKEDHLRPISKHKTLRSLLYLGHKLYLKDEEFAVLSSNRGNRSTENQAFFNSWYKKKYFVLQ